MPSNILVGCELILTGCVLQQNDFFGPKDIVKNRTRQVSGGDACLSMDDCHLIAAGGSFRFGAIAISSRKNQQTSLGPSVLDCCAHDGVDQFLQYDLTRHSFGHLDHSRELELLD